MSELKKAPKKAPAKHVGHEDAAIKDRRRAHEHLGRVEALHPLVEKPAAKQIKVLQELAHRELEAGHTKDAADLLRAAEHLSFGSLHAPEAEKADPKLKDALTREFNGKLEKADEHWTKDEEHLPELEEVYAHVTERAQHAFEADAYRQALELARAAEALGHVSLHGKEEEETESGEDKSERNEAL